MSGLILHPTSLPSRFGIGDLGPDARRFVDLLAELGQQLWQVLPLGPTYEPWFSPYSSHSAFAGNPYVISPELLHEQGLLSAEDLEAASVPPTGRVDFPRVVEHKGALLARASQAFKSRASRELRQQFEQFQHETRAWLDDFVLYMVIRQRLGRYWRDWTPELRDREPSALQRLLREKEEEVFHQRFLQFEFHRQWGELRRYANARKVRIIGDIAHFVSMSSADAWAYREYFQFHPDTLSPRFVSGAPPDTIFSSQGQRWGTPTYDWSRMAQDDFRWWVDRLRHNLLNFDYLRLDHFPGFESFWAIPAESQTAREGHWQKAPGEAFFSSLRRQLGHLPFIVEDLGIVTPAMRALRDKFELPGMFVLQYAFSLRPNAYRPPDCRPDFVTYTATHDTPTTVEWFQAISEPMRKIAVEYLGQGEPGMIHREMMRLAWSSAARWALAPLQDVMGLGVEGRMNTPGAANSGNWNWRFRWEQLSEEDLGRLAALTRTHGRAPAAE